MMTSTNIRQNFKLLTWNVWFDRYEFNKRFDEVMKLCHELMPDVVCFQEVTPTFCALMKVQQKANSASCWFSDYASSDPDFSGDTVVPYGTLTLSRNALKPKFTRHQFPTFMGRELLVTEITLAGDKTLHIGNVHLESLDNPDLRLEQLKICAAILPTNSSLICGDFNFCSYR